MTDLFIIVNTNGCRKIYKYTSMSSWISISKQRPRIFNRKTRKKLSFEAQKRIKNVLNKNFCFQLRRT